MQSRNFSWRRSAAVTAVFATAALIISGCAPAGSLSDDPSAGGSDADVFKVGLLAPMTGFVSAIGTDVKQGWDLYWSQNGTTAGKFTVETVLEDDASSAETAP